MISRALAPGSGEKFSDIRGAPVTNTSRPRVTAPSGAEYWFFQNPPRDSTRRRAVSESTARRAPSRKVPIACRSGGDAAASRPSTASASGATASTTSAARAGTGAIVTLRRSAGSGVRVT